MYAFRAVLRVFFVGHIIIIIIIIGETFAIMLRRLFFYDFNGPSAIRLHSRYSSGPVRGLVIDRPRGRVDLGKTFRSGRAGNTRKSRNTPYPKLDDGVTTLLDCAFRRGSENVARTLFTKSRLNDRVRDVGTYARNRIS